MWNTFIVDPMTNALLFIYGILGQNFGLSIIVFTLLVRLLTHPLTAKQLKSAAGLQDLQKSDKWQNIQTKFKDDREKLAQEQMKLYQEAGVSPFGSCLPTIIQFPVIIGLYQAIIGVLASSPLQLLSFSKTLYRFSPDSFLYKIFPSPASIIPIKSEFLWMNLGQPERLMIPFVPFGISLLAILVVITSFLQTRLMAPTTPGQNDQGAAMTKMMGLYFPVFIGYLTWTYASGLGLYFVVSNLFGIAQYAALGRMDLKNLFPFLAKVEPQKAPNTSKGKTTIPKAKGKTKSKKARP